MSDFTVASASWGDWSRLSDFRVPKTIEYHFSVSSPGLSAHKDEETGTSLLDGRALPPLLLLSWTSWIL